MSSNTSTARAAGAGDPEPRTPVAWARRRFATGRRGKRVFMEIERCPVCGKRHTHGDGGFGNSDGHKAPHCLERDIPEGAPRHYVVIEEGVPLFMRSWAGAIRHLDLPADLTERPFPGPRPEEGVTGLLEVDGE